MQFEDLLDEDGQSTRELDRFLYENIKGYNYQKLDHYTQTFIDKIIPHYTTGDSIDPTLNLAKDYFVQCDISFDHPSGDIKYQVEARTHIHNIKEKVIDDDLKMCLAEALFKAYQNDQ